MHLTQYNRLPMDEISKDEISKMIFPTGHVDEEAQEERVNPGSI